MGGWLLLAGLLLTLFGSSAIELSILLLLTPIEREILRTLALAGVVGVGVGIGLMAIGRRVSGKYGTCRRD